MSRKLTVVNYYGAQDDSRCGYCARPNTSQSHGNKSSLIDSPNYRFSQEKENFHHFFMFLFVF